MKLKNLKKISVFLSIITLFVSASPYKTYAADPTKEFPLVISANPVKVKPGETSKITATVLKEFDFKTIDNVGIGVANDPANFKRCNVTKENPTCSVEFTFADKDKGIVTIFGNLVIKTKAGNETLPSLPIAINVEVPDENQKPTGVKPEESVKATTDTTYDPLAKIPGLEGILDTKSGCPFGTYLNTILKVIIGFSAVLAFVMVVSGGIQYMSSEVISSKEEGKDTIIHAIMGLLIALGSYLILNTLNPQLLNACLNNFTPATITIISSDDTSDGSSTSLCISTSPPDPNNASSNTTVSYTSEISNEYIPALEKSLPNISKGSKLLITAHAMQEGFYKGSKSYRTKNPGNIGNTDDGNTKSFPTLEEGIKKQYDVLTNVANNNAKSYKNGAKPACALGDESYNGSLYQYLRIYSTGARMNNNYLSYVLSYFKKNNLSITPKTTLSEIYKMN